jgi:hypothetical protein
MTGIWLTVTAAQLFVCMKPFAVTGFVKAENNVMTGTLPMVMAVLPYVRLNRRYAVMGIKKAGKNAMTGIRLTGTAAPQSVR